MSGKEMGRVLVVDDEAGVRDIIRTYLEYDGMNVATASDGIEALKPAARIVYHHHEHFDGSGYPEGIRGEDIPIESRILQVADIFHSLISDRIYRKAIPLDKALSIIRGEMGTIIDPGVGQVFLTLIEQEQFRIDDIPQFQLP